MTPAQLALAAAAVLCRAGGVSCKPVESDDGERVTLQVELTRETDESLYRWRDAGWDRHAPVQYLTVASHLWTDAVECALRHAAPVTVAHHDLPREALRGLLYEITYWHNGRQQTTHGWGESGSRACVETITQRGGRGVRLRAVSEAVPTAVETETAQPHAQ